MLGAGVHAGSCGVEEPRHDRRSQERLVGGHRAREPDGVGSRIRADEAPRVRLGQPGADEGVLDDTPQALLLRQAPSHVPAQGHGVRDPVEHRPRDLLDEVDLAHDVAGAPGRDGHVPVVGDVEAESGQRRPLVVGRDIEADDLRRALRAEADDGSFRQFRMHVGVAGHAGSGQVDEQAAREDRRRLGEVRVDALLPAIGSSRSERQTLRGAENAERLEVGRLEEHLVCRVRDLAVLAAHDRREGHGALAVRDEEIVRVDRAERPVERSHLLARACVAHDDPAAGELRPVERVQWAPPDVHDVVRHVDDVRDRAHVGQMEP